jgi:hypothetical protein
MKYNYQNSECLIIINNFWVISLDNVFENLFVDDIIFIKPEFHLFEP